MVDLNTLGNLFMLSLYPNSEVVAMQQIILCRNGKCIDLYYPGSNRIDEMVECESLRSRLFE
jgi:hypothetical protein